MRRTFARPAFYARTGSPALDLLAVLHWPYTAWHLAYVAIGSALAPELDWLRLGGMLLAFFLGLGVSAHALDEWHTRPLGTALSGAALLALAIGGFAGAVALALAGAFVMSPWIVAWALAGVVLAAGYALEWDRRLHSDLGFALAWGGFPVLAGYWAQAESLAPEAAVAAAGAVLVSLAQRGLSTPARFVRRAASEGAHAELRLHDGRTERWGQERLLGTWEQPLRYLGAGVVLLALALLAGQAAS